VKNKVSDPIIVGGNGHSGTRVFAEILTLGGVFTGIRRITKRNNSEDLRIISLLTRWVRPYVYGTLTPAQSLEMQRAFSRRLRLYFPTRTRPWGFKNPRTMLLLPFLADMFTSMKFVHVIRDGRDISLGNEFVGNAYMDAYLRDKERSMTAEEKMIVFWGRSNGTAADFGESTLGSRYLRMKWEDLCTNPLTKTRELLQFAGCSTENAGEIQSVVRLPSSLGRWRSYPDEQKARVQSRGEPWLARFGYL
jgi:hypothetical protein